MRKDKGFNPAKRNTLKLITGIATAGIVTSVPAIAGIAPVLSQSNADDLRIDCMLISRADTPRAHLLMHNATDAEIFVSRFSKQLIRFDNTELNVASAFDKPVAVAANSKVMVRLNIDTQKYSPHATTNTIDFNSQTRFLPQGTRVVTFVAHLENGVGHLRHLDTHA